MIRRFSLAVLALCAFPLVAAAQGGPPQDRYIVVLNEGLNLPENVALDIAIQTGGQVGHVYEHALRGFSITMPRAALAGVQRDPRVDYVEEDKPVSIFGHGAQHVPTGIQRIFADGVVGPVDVDVAVIDTGIDFDHPDLDADASRGTDCTGGGPFGGSCGPGGDDDHDHGTHVAGTIGAIDNTEGVVGVVPGARLWAVKVLDKRGSGYMSWIVAGVDWVVARADEIEVINMSLGGSGTSDAMNEAIYNAVEAGIVVVVAAGNSDDEANKFTPANAPDAFTVSALADFDGLPDALVTDTSSYCRNDQDDTLADFSNWSELGVVDITAPGVCILSTVRVESGSYNTYSGTSMASPHAAGAAALLASGTNAPVDRTGVEAIWATLTNNGNCDWTDDSGDGVKEPLLDVSGANPSGGSCTLDDGGDGGGDTNSPPTASFTYSCTDLSCAFDGSGSKDSDGSISSYAWDFGDDTTGTGETVNKSYNSGGTYTVTLTVTDNDGATGSESQTVSVSDGSGEDGGDSTTMHVHDLDGSSNKSGPTWTAIVSVLVHDGSGPGSNVTVTGDFSPVGGTGLSCDTDDGGWCHFESGNIGNNTKSVKFTVTSHPGGDHDPDGDSDGTTITIFR